jgi:hypothetical protein
MSIGNSNFIVCVAALAVVLSVHPAAAGEGSGAKKTADDRALDFNEQTPLEFMCEEEKLARDVYITLGSKHPDSRILGKIDDSEERHKCAEQTSNADLHARF